MAKQKKQTKKPKAPAKKGSKNVAKKPPFKKNVQKPTPKNVKKEKKKEDQSQQEKDSIYDSEQDNQTQSIDQPQSQDYQISQEQSLNFEDDQQLNNSSKASDSQSDTQKEDQQKKTVVEKDQPDSYKTQPLEQQQETKQEKEKKRLAEERQKQINQIQQKKFEKFLKPVAGFECLKQEDSKSNASNVKIETTFDNSSIAPEPSDCGKTGLNDGEKSEYGGSQFTDNISTKHGHSQIKSTAGQSQAQDPQFLSYLVKIMNGQVSVQDMEIKRKAEQKKQKLQDKIRQIKKRKIQQKIKQQFDSQSQSQLKFGSVYGDPFDKNQMSSFNIAPKTQLSTNTNTHLKNQTQQPQKDKKNDNANRKKRTRVSGDMLKDIILDFQFLAKQQNGLVPSGFKVTFKDIGKKFNLGRSSVMKMYSDYCKDPTMKSRFQNNKPLAHNRCMMELTKRRITFVQRLIRKDCTLSQRQIAAEMNQHNDLKCKRKRRPDQTMQEYMQDPYHPIAYKAVSRLMKLGNFTRKKVTLIPANRNSQRTLEERLNFCRILDELIKSQKNKLYFLDQCRFNLFTSRDWGWAPKGQLATKIRHNAKGKDVMLLAIIGKQGLIGYEISDSYNRGSFTIAVNKLVNNIIPETVPEGQRIYLILDNCPIHNKDNLKDLETQLPLTILYLPPYSPMLNPIESWFGQLKRVVKSKVYKTRQAMKAELIRVLETFKQKSLANYYKGIEKYIGLGLQKKLYRGNNKF